MTLYQLAGLAGTTLCLIASTAAAPAPTPSTAAPTTQAAPSPNAYDSYLAAANSLGPTSLAALATVSNTVTHQDAATLAANARALKLLRHGFPYAFQKPAGAPVDMAYFNKMKALAGLLMLDARAAARRGDWNGAVNSSAQCIRLGLDLPHGGDTADLQIGMQCEALGRTELYAALPHLPPLRTVALARQLVRLQAHTVAYSDLLRAEQTEGKRLLLDLFKEPNWQKTEKTTRSSADLTSAYMRATELAIKNAGQPYAMHKTGVRQPDDPVLQLVLTRFVVEDMPQLGNDPFRFLYESNRAADSLLAVQASLLAFHGVQKYYPQTLNELVPFFFPVPPPDPFAIASPLQYRQVNRTYLLYSIGPDCTDNNGRPIDDPTQPDQRHRVYPTSLGDMVAGVNTR